VNNYNKSVITFLFVNTYYNKIKLIFVWGKRKAVDVHIGTVRACAAGILLYIYIYISETGWAAAKFETAAKKTW